MDKKDVINAVIAHFKKEIEVYERISKQAREDAISSENKQEGKYDTRAIEASYLAGAQKRRHEELILEVQKLTSFNVELLPKGRITIASLIFLEDEKSKEWYFLSPASGGFDVDVSGTKIKVVSSTSPIGKALISLEEDELDFVLKLPTGEKEYCVIEFC